MLNRNMIIYPLHHITVILGLTCRCLSTSYMKQCVLARVIDIPSNVNIPTPQDTDTTTHISITRHTILDAVKASRSLYICSLVVCVTRHVEIQSSNYTSSTEQARHEAATRRGSSQEKLALSGNPISLNACGTFWPHAAR